MIVAAVKENHPGERRVALVPASVTALAKVGATVRIESGAGLDAGFPDEAYRDVGAEVVADRATVIGAADVLCQVRCLGASPETGQADLAHFRPGLTVIGHADPLGAAAPHEALAATGVQCFAMELIPRITRAQNMDVLSSQATVGGYKAVLLAAETLPKMFPMLMTAAGTISAAHVFVIGAGVAGLQAIATARRLGAIVTAYDIRPAVAEQVESLGAKFLKIEVEAAGSEDAGGYAKSMDDAFYRRQREAMGEVVSASDVVITTAAVPGRTSPVLVTADMVERMATGSVIVDLAAERGGNCELTEADRRIDAHGVAIFGPTNLAATAPYHASQMYARNMTNFLSLLVKDGTLAPPEDDEIVQDTRLTAGGRVVHPRVCELLGIDHPDNAPAADAEGASA